jgi:hypothetical protein
MNKYKICKCRECRYSNHHTTQYHKCGTCKRFGHGQHECSETKQGNMLLIIELQDGEINANKIFNQCEIKNCKHKTLHSIGSHDDSFGTINTMFKLSPLEISWCKSLVHKSCCKHLLHNPIPATRLIYHLNKNDKKNMFHTLLE